MSGTLGYDDIRAAAVRQVAQLMAAAAITAPKSGGQLFLAGKPNFMETVIADDPATRARYDAMIPPGRRLANVLRVGHVSADRVAESYRLPVGELLV